MTFREQCALAAMREILSAGLARSAVADCGPLADMAWSCADAMAAERKRRDQPEAPEMPEPAPGRDDERAKLKEACEKARREGRDAGLRAVADECEQAIRDPELNSSNIPGLRLAIRMAARLSESQDAVPPKVKAEAFPDATPLQERLEFEAAAKVEAKLAALASENAKLRAVADGRVYCDDHGRFDDGEEAPDLPYAAPLRAAILLLAKGG